MPRFGFTVWFCYIIVLSYISVSTADGTSCYAADGPPKRCQPSYFNAAYNRSIEATNKCGFGNITDTSGKTYTDQVPGCYTSAGRAHAAQLHLCDAGDVNGSTSYPPSNMVDKSSCETWWQSTTLCGYQERDLGMELRANITLNLGRQIEMAYLTLKFKSTTPESFSLWKKTSENSDWEPLQYYSSSCACTYDLPQDGTIEDIKQAVCTGDYTNKSPQTDGQVTFSPYFGRPLSASSESHPQLTEFATVTSLQVRLRRRSTQGEEVRGRMETLQSCHYAISDLTLTGRCQCNGHADSCTASMAADGEIVRTCDCQHNTTGSSCDECIHGHYRTGSISSCMDCNCDAKGSDSRQCDESGRCRCKDGYEGLKCETCNGGASCSAASAAVKVKAFVLADSISYILLFMYSSALYLYYI